MSIESQPIQFTIITRASENSTPGKTLGCPIYALFRKNGPVVGGYTQDKGKFADKNECWDAVPAPQLAVYAVELEHFGYPMAYEQIKKAIDEAAWRKPIADKTSAAITTSAPFFIVLAPGKPRETHEYPNEIVDALMESTMLGFMRMVPNKPKCGEPNPVG